MSPLSSALSIIQVFGVSCTMIIFLSAFVKRVSLSGPSVSTNWTWITPTVLGTWFISANLIGYFIGLTVGTQFTLAGILQMGIPLVSGTLLLFFSKPLNRLLAKMPSSWLIHVQLYRIVGLFLLYLYFHDQYLSRGFALFTGGGDVFIGLTSIIVGRWVSVKGKGYQVAAIVWNILGITDLVMAPISARTFGGQGITVYPMVLVPLFLGPPLGIFLHLASLRNLYLHAKKDHVKKD
jgi:hypothetical protein